MSIGSILVVCTGNICRSPVGEAALRALLPSDVSQSSGGTHAMVGAPAAPEALHFISREIGADFDHTAQQLTPQHAEQADLIVAMTSEQRAWIARTAPRAVRRTFTLRELELIVDELPEGDGYQSLREFALAASRLRVRVPAKRADLDIADPYGGPPEAYESSFQQVLGASRIVAASIRTLTSHA